MYSQPVAAPPTGPVEIDIRDPKKIVAKLDGQSLTAYDYQNLIASLDPKLRDAARGDAREVLRSIGWMRRIAAEAEKRGLSNQNPLKTQLEMSRQQLLASAMMLKRERDEQVTLEQEEQFYKANLPRFTGAEVAVIYLPFTNPTDELQAKRKAEEIHAKLKTGGDFGQLAKEFSQDKGTRDKGGQYGEIRQTDQIPPLVKDSVFKMKDGEYSEPLRLPNGYWFFKRTKTNVDSFDKVKDKIFIELRQKRTMEWTNQQRTAIQVEVKPKTPGTDPARVVGTINGQPLTAKEVDELLAAMDPRLRESLRTNPAELLRGVGFIRYMAQLAEKEKLDQVSPTREQVELNRLQQITGALLPQIQSELTVTDQEARQFFDEHKNDYSVAKVKIIYLSFEDAASENQAKLTGENIQEKLKSGADFVQLVKQYSKDPVSKERNGDYDPIRRSDDLPPALKEAVFSLQPGEVKGPVRGQGAYYMLKLVEYVDEPFEKVKANIVNQVKTTKNRAWLNSIRTQVNVEILAAKQPEPKKELPQ